MTPDDNGAPDLRATLGARRPFERDDWLAIAALAALSAALLLPGLSIRAIWGSEGRWAVIAREMMQTGDYLTPTINAEPYCDKPLPSYWAIVPFAHLAGGVTEGVARLPSALAGIAMVLVTFAVGRRLFGRRTGLIAGALLATSAMFIFWSRTASADLLNMLAVWVVIWCFVEGAADGSFGWLIALYSAAAVGSFMKGPVAAAVAFAGIGFYSSGSVVLKLRSDGFSWPALAGSIRREFCWILSLRAAAAIAIGAAIFAAFLLIPTAFTGDWSLPWYVWRENVLRFLDPFDHVEPAYIYLKHAATHFAPWSLLFIAALWDARSWPAGRERRFAMLLAAGVFVFFTASGSRRSYYILPFVPVMALVTAQAADRCLRGAKASHMKIAAVATALLLGAVSAALICAYLWPHAIIAAWKVLADKDLSPDMIPRAALQMPAAVLTAACAIGAVAMLVARRTRAAGAGLLAAAIVVQLWGFTAGMAAGERIRTLRPFCAGARRALEGVPDRKIALYRTSSAPLIFYLARRSLPRLSEPAEVWAFAAMHPGGFIIADLRSLTGRKARPVGPLPPVEIVLRQQYEQTGARRKLLALARCRPGQSGHPSAPGAEPTP